MYRFSKSFLILMLSGCVLTKVGAQPNTAKPNNAVLNKYQDSLTSTAAKIFSAAHNEERFDQNSKFIKTLVAALKTPSSFNYGFDSLKTITVLESPDHNFRIFSWYVPADDGTYRFFGTIQMATKDGRLKLYPLIDASFNMKDNNEITTGKNWYGARYYEIVPLIAASGTSYALLGWKGNNSKTSKKVIEILTFANDDIRFGKPVFQDSVGKAPKNRIVFEYNKLNSMTLRLDKTEGMIVFDHLAPFDPNMVGNYEYYASDSSFDGYRLVGDQLKLIENIELKNDPSVLDDFYVDPKSKNPPVTKKF